MAIQDDIFDVKDALKRKPEKESFERILRVFYALETENENLVKVLKALGSGMRALKYVEEEFGKPDD